MDEYMCVCCKRRLDLNSLVALSTRGRDWKTQEWEDDELDIKYHIPLAWHPKLFKTWCMSTRRTTTTTTSLAKREYRKLRSDLISSWKLSSPSSMLLDCMLSFAIERARNWFQISQRRRLQRITTTSRARWDGWNFWLFWSFYSITSRRADIELE